MKKSVKALLLVMCAIVLVVATVFTTLAFLQDKTGTIKNTFTVGSVAINLTETKVNLYGEKVTADGKTDDEVDGEFVAGIIDANEENFNGGNEYKLVPGQVYTKDPKVTVDKASEPSYVYIAVKNSMPENLLDVTDEAYDEGLKVDSTWSQDASITLEGYSVYYKEVTITDGKDAELNVFGDQEFKMASGATPSAFEIEIKAYAIQKDSFDAITGWAEVSAQANA